MDSAHLRKMQKAAARQRVATRKVKEREAIKRVKAYKAWLAKGSPLKQIPAIPSDDDWAIAREHKVVK